VSAYNGDLGTEPPARSIICPPSRIYITTWYLYTKIDEILKKLSSAEQSPRKAFWIILIKRLGQRPLEPKDDNRRRPLKTLDAQLLFPFFLSPSSLPPLSTPPFYHFCIPHHIPATARRYGEPLSSQGSRCPGEAKRHLHGAFWAEKSASGESNFSDDQNTLLPVHCQVVSIIFSHK